MANHSWHIKNPIIGDISLILFLSAIIYLPFLGLPAWNGHEPMRVIVSEYMLKSGNWIIPMLHGKLYLIKPPLMNWLIAASGALFGTLNEWTSRIPSVLMIVMTGLSIYCMTGKWLSREGRLVAAIAAISMIGLIEKGREADMDSLFIFSVVSILLIWINGYTRKWNPFILWSISLLLLSIGFLAKGPQVLAFFYLTIFAYLLLKKDLAFFLSKAHLLGLLFFILVLAGYLSFVLKWVTFNEYIHMWIDQITQRGESRYPHAFLKHIVTYPLEAMASFMPWTLLIVPVLFYREPRRAIREVLQNELFLFAIVMVAANFPLYWVLKSARVRYYLPAGPFLAISIAALYEYFLHGNGDAHIVSFVRRLVKFLSWSALLSLALMIPLLHFLKLSLSPTLLSMLLLISSLAVFILHRINSMKFTSLSFCIAALTGLVFLTYTHIDFQRDSREEEYPRDIASHIQAVLPHDVETIYEMGYRRLLDITCYLEHDVIQLDNFRQLQSLSDQAGKGQGVFFIFDSAFLSRANPDERDILLREISWQKVISFSVDEGGKEIILGHLMRRADDH